MNIAFIGGLNPKGPESKNQVDSVTVSRGQDNKKDNKTQGFLQILDKSRQEIKSDAVKNNKSKPRKNESHSVGKTRTAKTPEASKLSHEAGESTEPDKTNGQRYEELNSLLLELVNLLNADGITPKEVNNSQGDTQVQSCSGQTGVQPEALAASQQKAHIMQLLQMAGKLAGEMQGTVNTDFQAVLQNLLTMTDTQLTDVCPRIDARFIEKIMEALKKRFKEFESESTGK